MILKDDDVSADIIKKIRNHLNNETQETRNFLGITSKNLNSIFPIKNRKFFIWVLIDDFEEIIGTLTFEIQESHIFMKILYVLPKFRTKGYGLALVYELVKNYPKVCAKIDVENQIMHKFAGKIGLVGENGDFKLSVDNRSKPIWWSNY